MVVSFSDACRFFCHVFTANGMSSQPNGTSANSTAKAKKNGATFLLPGLGQTAAVAGAIAAARVQRALVVLDGGAALAAALVLHALRPDAVAHCILAQRPRSVPLAQAANRIGLAPLLDLGLDAPGEAGALAAGLVKVAAAVASVRAAA